MPHLVVGGPRPADVNPEEFNIRQLTGIKNQSIKPYKRFHGNSCPAMRHNKKLLDDSQWRAVPMAAICRR
jgi:hypothetical protein